MDETRQDVWMVEITHQNELGKVVFGGRKGFLELPYPMTAFEAADYAIRAEIRDVIGDRVPNGSPRSIHAELWGKRRKGLAPGRSRACTASSQFDKERGRYLRPTPWFDKGPQHEEIGDADGAVVHPADWE